MDALSSAAGIFSAATATGLMKDCPEIAKAIKEWSASDRSDSTLVSMLEKNSDLKIILLSSTPWIENAKSDTERMQRLSMLFDNDVINSTYTSAINNLKDLQCSDGGLKWAPFCMEPSRWATENFLSLIGRLKKLGYLPSNDDIHEITVKAIAYLDSCAKKDITSHHDYTDISYVMIRDMFPELPIKGITEKLVDNTLAMINKDWKGYNVAMKAIAALILDQHNKESTAETILKSLREYAVTSPEKGMWWPSLDEYSAWSMGKIGGTAMVLDAFAAIDPTSPDIDLIRQWLILQKETKDWGTSVTTSEAITSILLNGSKWTKSVEPATVKLNDKIIVPGVVAELTGEFRADISDMNPSGATLVVEKSGDTPAWGATYCQFTADMAQIKASSCEAVEIEKSMFKRVNTPQGVKWVEADTLNVGDILQINLTIKSTRDMDYVTIIDNRAACLEPVEQLSKNIYAEDILFYRENRDAATNIFVTHLPKGVYRLSYEMNVNNSGRYASGIASLQSQYAPQISAHSSGTALTVSK
jgi:hypothetical protein